MRAHSMSPPPLLRRSAMAPFIPPKNVADDTRRGDSGTDNYPSFLSINFLAKRHVLTALSNGCLIRYESQNCTMSTSG
jgi:hypothetical protein